MNAKKILNKIKSKGDFNIEEAKLYTSILQQNSESCLKQFYFTILAFLISVIIWILIKFSVINNVNFYGIELNDKKLIVIFLPLVSTFIFYRSFTLLVLNHFIDEVLLEMYEHIFPNLKDIDSPWLLPPPSFFRFEEFVQNESNKTKISKGLLNIWMVFLLTSIFVLPLIAIWWMVITNFSLKSVLSITVGLICLFVSIRLLVLVYTLGEKFTDSH